MDVVSTIGSDLAILLFTAAGLAATTVAILLDARTQVQSTELAREPVRIK